MSEERSTTMADAPDACECFPLDLSVNGLWWVRCMAGHFDANGVWEVWRWSVECRCWWRGSNLWEPTWAAQQGWRCIARAVPPNRMS